MPRARGDKHDQHTAGRTRAPGSALLLVWWTAGVVVTVAMIGSCLSIRSFFQVPEHPSREALLHAIKDMPRPAGASLDEKGIEYESGCETAGQCFGNYMGSGASMRIRLKSTPVENCLAVLRAFTHENLRLTVDLDEGDVHTGDNFGRLRYGGGGDYLLDDPTCETGRVGRAYVTRPNGRLAGPEGIALWVVLPRHSRFDLAGSTSVWPETARYGAEESKKEREPRPQAIPAEMRALLVG
jgi:hypothetical protein